MRPEQKVVAIGAASGVATMIVAVWLLTMLLPVPRIQDAIGPRLSPAT